MNYFIKNQQIEFEENKQHEFKEIKADSQNSVSSIASTVPEYLVAFLNVLNGKGGSIYWGITDKGIVSGVKLSREQRDDIGKNIDNIINNIKPPITPSMYKIIFHHIYDDSHEVISGLYVVEIAILNIENHLYFKNGRNCIIKTDSGKKELVGIELVAEIKKRYQIQDISPSNTNILELFQFIDDIKPIFRW